MSLLCSRSRTAAAVVVPSCTRSFATSTPLLAAASTAHLPKRDSTRYGTHQPIPRNKWPIQSQTDTTAHPLWKFFHQQESLQVPDKRKDNTSRSWTSLELRRKSFEDLHALWYILLQERNVLLTQREEARRLRIDLKGFSAQGDMLRMTQKSMTRLKQTLSERRLAALEAAAILRSRGEEGRAQEVEESAGPDVGGDV